MPRERIRLPDVDPPEVDAPGVEDRDPSPAHQRPAARLEALLSEGDASDAAGLAVDASRGCGTLEVRVSGPRASLKLFFDLSETEPSEVLSSVRKELARYASSLGHRRCHGPPAPGAGTPQG